MGREGLNKLMKNMDITGILSNNGRQNGRQFVFLGVLKEK
jgi:hypothetical protein